MKTAQLTEDFPAKLEARRGVDLTRWTSFLPVAIAIAIALIPPPEGLGSHAWYFFAIFAGVIAGLVVEPLPGPAIGLIAITIVAVLSRWVLFSPAELARPEFNVAESSIRWAISGFANSTVWLVFAAFMFGLGYEKTGLGRRIALVLVKAMGRRTLLLGYAVTLTDAILAPFTPSNTARSAGTIFPVVRNLPPLYGSLPNDPSSRKIGGYIMWTTFAAGCITSSLFMTACAPNLLALEFIRKTVKADITWLQWFFASAPFALPLLLALPILTYWFFPPEIKQGSEVPRWAAGELAKMGPPSGRELNLAVLVLIAVGLWVFGGEYINPTTAALMVISLMLITGVVSWEEMAANKSAWTTLALLAMLVTLADGLTRTGFIKWFSQDVGAHLMGLSPTLTVIALIAAYFFSHYMFASLTAHTTAMMPVMLGVGLSIPGLPMEKLALLLALTTGIMGVISPYATGPGLAYYESGYLPSATFWRLATIFGFIFLAAILLIGAPILLLLR
jgi:L-tartrate/succinate antiporter